jgi:hypothetical protein
MRAIFNRGNGRSGREVRFSGLRDKRLLELRDAKRSRSLVEAIQSSSGGTLDGRIMMKSAVVIVVEIVVYGLGGFVKSKHSLRSSARTTVVPRAEGMEAVPSTVRRRSARVAPRTQLRSTHFRGRGISRCAVPHPEPRRVSPTVPEQIRSGVALIGKRICRSYRPCITPNPYRRRWDVLRSRPQT